jgi:competence protein ComEC
MSRPLLLLGSAFGAGCLVGGEGSGRLALLVAGLAGLLLATSVASRERRAAWSSLLVAALGLGAAAATVERLAYERAPLRAVASSRRPADGPAALEGTLRGDADLFPDRARFILDVSAMGAAGGTRAMTGAVRIEVGGHARLPALLDRDRVRVWALLRAVDGYRTPGAYDAREAAFRDGVHARGTTKSARLVEREAQGTGVRAAAARVRESARAVFARYVLAGTEEGLVRAMVIGDRTGIDDPTAEAFRAAGTYHVLALSGAQVALVAALLVGGLRWIGAGPSVQAVVTVAAVAFYALLVGGDVPVVRAAVMASVVLVGRALELDADAANLLGLAGLLLLAHRPSSVTDVGFQLSFAATLGVLLLTLPLVAGLPRLPLRLETMLAASVAAQAAILPLMAGQFHRTAPAALLLNLLAVPLSSAVLLAGLALFAAASFAPGLAPLLGDLAWVLAHALRRSSEPAALLPVLDWRGPALSGLALAAWVTALVWLVRGRRARGLALLGGTLLLPLVGPGAPGDGRLHLTVLDVGQGDALVVRSPGGQTLLVDAGGSSRGRFDVGERVVAPYLWGAGVRRIDSVVLTHAHPDHAGGLPFLLRAFPVGSVWEGLAPRGDPGYAALVEAEERARTDRRSVVRGVEADWDGVEVRVRSPWPGPPPWKIRNDDSVVLTLRLGDVRFLLTGDVEAGAESRLLSAAEELGSAVAKIPHHGSRGSSGSAFVAAVAPALAIASAGVGNPFGHPHPEALRRYEGRGAIVLRTDRDGTVWVATDGRRLWLRNYGDAVERRIR